MLSPRETPTDRRYLQLPFALALEYLAGKIDMDTDTYVDGQGPIQDVVFTVAAAKGALLSEIRRALTRAITAGESVDQFLGRFDQIADRWAANWSLKGDRAWRGQIIYEQNLRQAYAAGRYAQMARPEVKAQRPYWQWRHGGSLRPRPSHLALDRRVFAADSLPFFPPAGFGCRCQIFSLSQRDLEREGLVSEAIAPGDSLPYTDPATGKSGMAVIQPDPGFNRIPGRLTPEQRRQLLASLEPGIREQVEADGAD